MDETDERFVNDIELLREADAVPYGSERLWASFLVGHERFTEAVCDRSRISPEEFRELSIDVGEDAMKLVLHFPRLAKHPATEALRNAVKNLIRFRLNHTEFMVKASLDEIFELAVAGERIGFWPDGPVNLGRLRNLPSNQGETPS